MIKLDVEITSSKVRKGKLYAVASIRIEDSFIIRYVKLEPKNDGITIEMPSFDGRYGRKILYAHPVKGAIWKELERLATAKYREEMKKEGLSAYPPLLDFYQ